MWVITRQALVINSAAWSAMKETTFNLIRTKLSQPEYEPETFLDESVAGESAGCVYTPCTGIEAGLTGCP